MTAQQMLFAGSASSDGHCNDTCFSSGTAGGVLLHELDVQHEQGGEDEHKRSHAGQSGRGKLHDSVSLHISQSHFLSKISGVT